MARSGHIADIRAVIGSRLLLMPSVSNAVLDPGGKLLLLRHTHHGMWGTPGGAMEPGETPAQAAARELYEETRLSLTPEAIIAVTGGPDHVIHYPNGDETAYVTTIFCVPWEGQPIQPDGVEVDAYRWVGPDAWDEVPMDQLTHRNVATIFRWLAQPPDRRSARFE